MEELFQREGVAKSGQYQRKVKLTKKAQGPLGLGKSRAQIVMRSRVERWEQRWKVGNSGTWKERDERNTEFVFNTWLNVDSIMSIVASQLRPWNWDCISISSWWKQGELRADAIWTIETVSQTQRKEYRGVRWKLEPGRRKSPKRKTTHLAHWTHPASLRQPCRWDVKRTVN